jgi:hypothetical protein
VALAKQAAAQHHADAIHPRHKFNQADEREECIRRMRKYLRLSRNVF